MQSNKPSLRQLVPSNEKREDPAEPSPKKKRIRTTKVACDGCRAKKTACDGARPICTPCQARSSNCVYVSVDQSETPSQVLKRENEQLREKSKALETLLDYLRHLPEETSQGLLQQLRANIDPITLLESVRGSPSSIQPLGQAAARSIIPSVHTELELELMIRHSISYPTLDHSGRDELMSSYSSKFVADLTSTATTDTDGALSTNTEVVLTTGLHHQIGVSSSTRHGKARASNNQSYVQDVEIQYRRKVDALLGTPSRLEGHDRAGTEPQPSYYDQRLEHLDIKFWTTVSVTTQFAASAISIYLVTDHPVFGLFDAELFITDLVECKLNYCCPFLVSSLLAFASRAYTSEDGSAAMKSKEFEKEAEQLWLTNKSEDSILSIAALTLLFGSEGSHGQLVPSLEYLHEMFEMAKRLRLLGVRDSIHDGELALMNKNDQISTSQAAWGAFNCLVWAVQHVNAPMFENLELIEPRCSPSPGFEIQSNIRHYFRYQDTQGG